MFCFFIKYLRRRSKHRNESLLSLYKSLNFVTLKTLTMALTFPDISYRQALQNIDKIAFNSALYILGIDVRNIYGVIQNFEFTLQHFEFDIKTRHNHKILELQRVNHKKNSSIIHTFIFTLVSSNDINCIQIYIWVYGIYIFIMINYIIELLDEQILG